MFLEIQQIKKHFGEGESRVDVLRALTSALKKAKFVYCWDLPVPENPRC